MVLTGVAVLGMWLSSARAEDVVITEEARERFSAGVALLEDPEGPRYEEAYQAFKAAYAASPSPKILGNIGLCAMKLERDGEAMESYRRYLDEVDDIPDQERAQIERDLAILEASSGRVTVTADEPGFEVVDERIPVKGPIVRNVYGPFDGTSTTLRLHAGAHRLRIEDGEPISVKVEGGKTTEVTLASGAEQVEDRTTPQATQDVGLPVAHVSRPLTLPERTFAPALRVRVGQYAPYDDRFLLAGLDVVNARYGILDDLELEAEIAPLEIRPRLDYGTAAARLTYRFLDEVVELGSAVRLGHVLYPYLYRRFLAEPQLLRMLAHAGSRVRIDSGFSLPIYFGGDRVLAGMNIPVDVAIQAVDVFYVGLGTGVGILDFENPGPSTFIPASAFVGATVPLDDRPLLDVGGRFTIPQLLFPGRDGDHVDERNFVGSLTLRLYFFL